MSAVRAFLALLSFTLAALLASAPASALSTASATMVLTLDFQGAFFTDTLVGAIDGVDYQLEPIFNSVDSLPQLSAGVGSAAIAGSITVNGNPLDSNVPLQEDDQIIFTISGNASAAGPGSFYAAFYENNSQIFGELNQSLNLNTSLTFVFDWSVLFTTALDSEPLDGTTLAISDGATNSQVLWGNTGFAFGDQPNGIPTMPQDSASGQLQIVVNSLNNPSFNLLLNSSVFVRAEGGVVPEPSTALLLGMGTLGVLGLARRRRIASK